MATLRYLIDPAADSFLVIATDGLDESIQLRGCHQTAPLPMSPNHRPATRDQVATMVAPLPLGCDRLEGAEALALIELRLSQIYRRQGMIPPP